MRIKFEKGKQREFIDKVLEVTGCPSLGELIRRGIDVDYSSLKSYYSERRLLPERLFSVLCEISNLEESSFYFTRLPESWGQVRGGRKSRRK